MGGLPVGEQHHTWVPPVGLVDPRFPKDQTKRLGWDGGMALRAHTRGCARHTVDNGISFCSLHHKLFDRGAFTLDDERRVVLSKRLTSSEPTRSAFEAQHGPRVRLPREELEHPRLEYVQWHWEEVFQGPGLAVS